MELPPNSILSRHQLDLRLISLNVSPVSEVRELHPVDTLYGRSHIGYPTLPVRARLAAEFLGCYAGSPTSRSIRPSRGELICYGCD